MSIIERTELLHLTQYSGSSLMAQFVLNYNEDMRKIDGHFSDYESAINQRVSDLQTEVAQFETDMTSAFNTLSDTVGTFDGRVTTLEQCCSDVNTTLLNYGSRLNAIEQVIETVSTANIDALTERVNALENKVQVNETNISILRNDLHELDERVTTAEGTIVQHSGLITSNTNRITTLEQCCDDVRSTIATLDTRISNNKSEIDALKLRVTANEGNIAANAQDITILSGQVAVNTADIEDLKQGLAELDPTSQLEVVRQVAVNTTDIANLKVVTQSQAQNLTSLTNRVALDEDVISTHTGQITQLQSDIAQVQSWESRIQTCEQKADDATSAVTQIELSVQQLSASLVGVAADVADNASEISGLKTRVTNVETAQATDEANMVAIEARVAANEADLVLVHQTITNDETGLASAVSRIGALESQCGNTPLTTVAQTLSGGVEEVNTKVVNADSKATQALSIANATSTTVGDASSGLVHDVAENTNDISALETTVGDSNSGLVKDVSDNASDIAQNTNDISALDARVDALEDATKYTVGQEVKIGTYLGKDLFRRTIKGTLPNSTNADAILNNAFVTGTTAVPMYERYIPTNTWSANGKIYVTKFWGVARHQVNGNIQVGQVPIPVVFNDRQLVNVWHWNIGTNGEVKEQIMLRTAGYVNCEYVLNVEYTKEDTLLP